MKNTTSHNKPDAGQAAKSADKPAEASKDKLIDKQADKSEVRELAQAMNRLADAIHQTNTLLAEARREDPNWRNLPQLITEIGRQLRMIASRL